MIRAVASLLTLLAVSAQAQTAFPTRTVKLLIPFPAGGINDVVGRIVADKLQAKWGQPVIVEDKAGAGGNIGAELVYKAPADGYTLTITPPGPLSINQTLYKHLAYKPEEFVPLTVVSAVPNVVLVRNELPVNTLAELVDHVKRNPGKLVFSSPGLGTTPHLTGYLLMSMTHTQMLHVPYRGESQIYQEMLGGRIDVFFGNLSGALALWRDGKIRALAVLDKQRAAQMPNVPTVAEAGMPDFISTTWLAAAAPPGLPARLQRQIAGAMIEVLREPDLVQKFRALQLDPVGSTPPETARFIKSEAVRWGDVIRKTGVVVD